LTCCCAEGWLAAARPAAATAAAAQRCPKAQLAPWHRLYRRRRVWPSDLQAWSGSLGPQLRQQLSTFAWTTIRHGCVWTSPGHPHSQLHLPGIDPRASPACALQLSMAEVAEALGAQASRPDVVLVKHGDTEQTEYMLLQLQGSVEGSDGQPLASQLMGSIVVQGTVRRTALAARACAVRALPS
jgi:hypothetical protein